MIWALLACSSTQADVRPDIVLISVDTLRADHVGVYGYARDTTPFLDELAAGGLVYRDARSPTSWTLPTHTTMLSGQLPIHHGVVDDKRQVPPHLPWLPEQMRAQGYSTVGVVTTFFVSERFGFDRGFDFWDDFDIHRKAQATESPDAEVAVDRLLRGIRGQDGPVFAFLHLYDVHAPYDTPGPFQGDDVDRYDNGIAHVDAQLERLADELGPDTVLVITSDHGEELGDRGAWGHGHTLHPEQLHVPLIAHGPGVPVGEVQGRVGTQDIAGWILGEQPWGEEPPPRTFVSDTSRFDTNRIALYDGPLRYDWDLATDHAALYADPAESVDVSAERPQDAARMRRALIASLGQGWEGSSVETQGVIFANGDRVDAVHDPMRFQVIPLDAEVRGATPLGPQAATIELSADERARLEALGYLQ